ncbi:MAG: F0F1 ATP synthase subunit B [Chloroherpetonaceae bacterium]|nr:F0F1 ATP synthase subunit B [Chloroherpetonaceae bacterium]
MIFPVILEGSLLSPNPGLIFWTAITFLVLLFVLRKIAWGPILAALDEREKNIQSAIERAEIARKEAEKILIENREILKKAEIEAEKIIKDARNYGEKLAQDIRDKASAEARKMVTDAKVEIENEKQLALSQLRNEVSDLAIKGAEMIIRNTLDAEKHKNVIASIIDEMKTETLQK